MTVTGPDQHRSAHIEVLGALDADALALVIRLAHSTIRSGCVEVLLQLQALTDFPTQPPSREPRPDPASPRVGPPLDERLAGARDEARGVVHDARLTASRVGPER